MSPLKTCEARAKSLWGAQDTNVAEEAKWWRRLVELVATQGFFVADEKFPDQIADYVRRRVVDDEQAREEAFDQLLGHCDAWCRKLVSRKLDKDQKEQELEVKRSFHTELKAFFRALRGLMVGRSDDRGSRRPAAFTRVFAAVLHDLKLPPATIVPLTDRAAQAPLTRAATPASVGHRHDGRPPDDPRLHPKTSPPLASKPSLGATSVPHKLSAAPSIFTGQLHLSQSKVSSAPISQPLPQTAHHDVVKKVRFAPGYAPEPRHTRRLINLGITCFMNASLQLLYDLEDFREGVKRTTAGSIPITCRNRESLSRLPGILEGLRSIFGAMDSYEKVKITDINNFDALASLKPALRSISCTEQDDAQTFLSNLTTPIIECLPELTASFAVPSDELRFDLRTGEQVMRDESYNTRAAFLTVSSDHSSMQERVVIQTSEIVSSDEVHKFAGITPSKYLIIVVTQRAPLTDYEQVKYNREEYRILGVISHLTGSNEVWYQDPKGEFRSSGAASGHYVYTRRDSAGGWAEYNDDKLHENVPRPSAGYIFLYKQVARGS